MNEFTVLGSNTYAAAGTYTVSITITDSNGASTTVTTTITVAQADDTDVPADDDPSRPAVAALLRPKRWDDDTVVLSDDDLLGADLWDADGWLADPSAETVATPEGRVPAANPDESAEASRQTDAVFVTVAEASPEPVTGVLVERWGEGGEADAPAGLGAEDLTAALVSLLDDLFAAL